MSREIAGRFVLLDPIGSGGMGTVWRAWDRRREEFVAAKVLSGAERDRGGDLLLRFVREQSMRIAHPHVVSPTSWAAEDDEVVLAMELVRGGSVADLLADHGPLPDGYVAVLLRQLLAALAAAHDAGIVHRDLKPANLLLEPTGTGMPHLRLADFGVAARAEDLVRFPGVVGTDGYMPPEQAAGAPPHPTQDVYAAGRVAIELLTGVRPQHGAPGDRPSDDPGAAAGPLRGLLAAMTEPDPTRRLGSAHEAARRLAALDLAFRDGAPTGSPSSRGAHPDVPDRLGDADAPRVPPGEGITPARRRRTPWWLGS